MNETATISDRQFLARYARDRAEDAFAELVRRHVNLVHSAALRQVRSPQLAEEVAQSVFTDLARNAHRLARGGDAPSLGSLTPWLYQVTRRTAIDVVRREARRQLREQIATEMNAISATTADWTHIEPLLDEAMSALDDTDRTAVLLRYFENKTLREVGQQLGTSDDAAQKRVSRAVERLREFFAKRGVTVGASGLAVVISANAVQAAPVGLAVTIFTAAALAGTTVAVTTIATATKAIAMTTLQKTVVTTTVAVLAGVGIYEARQAAHLRARITAIQQEPRSLPGSSNDAALSALQEKIDLLAAQNADLAGALALANTDRARLATEREQAKRAAALYKELGDLANPKDTNPTNAYPTERHVWVGWGRFGRMGALSKEGNAKLSPEEKSALEAAQMKILEELPHLVKATKQFAAAKSSSLERPEARETDEMMDMVTCLLYGALNLDEQQFYQVYGVMQKLGEEAKLKGVSKENPEAAEAIKQFVEEWKAETQTLLTPEQARIFAEVVTHFQVEPGNFGFNFSF
ncbi:MAG: sigma-70 family RNA polymerase sigma factor [Verrucomicrobia bacterium]|nr:sigma-70 family RNA polymerase sigma factor [Verrucomicrobiota bacterium]